MKNLLLILLCFYSMSIFGQISESDDAVFQVEFEKFKPSNQDQIREFEGKAPMQFLAPDVDGEEQFLGNFKGKTVFVYFFNQSCTICKEQINAFNLMHEEKGDNLKIIAIGDGSKEELKMYQETNGINYSVLYNGKMLGEAAYGIEMGYPRLFVLDEEGIARHVLPEEAFVESKKTYLMLDNLYKLVNSN